MNGGTKATLLASCFMIGGCAAGPREVKVRALDPAASISQAGDEVAVARGQLALGNVGLALEAFRKAQRDRPTDTAPLAGIAECYVSMGRFDLAQQNYEAALALTPRDPKLLLGLAAVFENEGQLARAADARADAANAVRSASSTAAVIDQPLAAEVASGSSITVELPPARPADVVAPDAGSVSAPTQATPSALAEQSELTSAVTIELPPVRELPAPTPLPRPAEADLAVTMPAPRLERLSSGEVALVTTTKPIWEPQRMAKTSSPVPVRWVALAPPNGRPNVQVLNAARSQGIASSARGILLSRGWRRIAIGDAPGVQQTSVVYYPKSHAALGRRLAAQFGVKAQMTDRDDVVLVLGRDSLERIAGQQRS